MNNKGIKKISFLLIGLFILFTAQVFADTSATVYTPNGTAVSVLIRTEMTSAEISSMNSYWTGAYPNATYISTSTNRYNCHSYGFYSQSYTTNNKWMNNPSAYWTDGSYNFVSSLSANDRLLYADSNGYLQHTAIYQGGIVVVSKWGAAPLFRHDYNYSPYTTAQLYGLRR